ncbi:MAG: alpha-ketoglutarate-dependent dioxygenase AlkB [Synechococcus sp.]|nr:alpha-ketoglutarate-dependent dioxygenase AlkB [Synechococcus sp.]
MAGLPWRLHKTWLSAPEAFHWRGLCRDQLAWEQPEVLVYGRRYSTPRLAAFLAETGVSYRYSGVVHHGSGWPHWFHPLLTLVNTQCGVAFNGCLLNYYRTGQDRMGWHADDEPEIDPAMPIASLSLGATRTFQLKERQGGGRHSLELADGDLLVMVPPCQREWLHGLPVRQRVTTPRINLTFRVFRTTSSG